MDYSFHFLWFGFHRHNLLQDTLNHSIKDINVYHEDGVKKAFEVWLWGKRYWLLFYSPNLLVRIFSYTTLASFYICWVYILSDKYCCCWNIYQRTILINSPSVYISINLCFCCFHKANIICLQLKWKTQLPWISIFETV